MIRRNTAVFVLVAASIAPIASAADLKSNIRAVAQMNSSTSRIAALFQKNENVTTLADGTVLADPTFPHVMVVAVTAEGEDVSACAVTEKAVSNVMKKAARPQLDAEKEQ